MTKWKSRRRLSGPHGAGGGHVGTSGADERHGDIAAAARALFLTQGYEATTVDQIARAAGVSRATVFRHAGTKDDILFARYERVLAEVRAQARADRGPDIERARRAVLHLATELQVAEDKFFQEVELICAHTSLRDRSVLLLHEWADQIARDLAGNRPGGVSLRTRVAAHASVSAFQQAACAWREQHPRKSLVRLTNEALCLGLPADSRR